jgi:hypothetical protein
MDSFYEEIKVMGKDLVEKIKSIIHEGNVRRIILKDEKGHTFLEIPLSIAAVSALAAPLLAALGAIAALVANFTVVVERAAEPSETKAETKAETKTETKTENP